MIDIKSKIHRVMIQKIRKEAGDNRKFYKQQRDFLKTIKEEIDKADTIEKLKALLVKILKYNTEMLQKEEGKPVAIQKDLKI